MEATLVRAIITRLLPKEYFFFQKISPGDGPLQRAKVAASGHGGGRRGMDHGSRDG